MKTIKISILLFAMFFIGSLTTQQVYAKKPATDKPAYVEQLNKIVTQTVKYPDFSLTKEERGDISVTFSLTDDGKIKIEKVTAPSERIREYVQNQLNDVSCKDIIHPYGQKYNVSLSFRTL